MPPDEPPEEPLRLPPNECPAIFAAADTALVAIITSDSIEPPVCPTFTPRLAMKLSIFCDTFRKATAQRNQIRTLPATVSLPEASTCACISLSVTASAGTEKNRQITSAIATAYSMDFFLLVFLLIDIPPGYSESGFEINAPTMLTNRRRHQAFIRSRNTCPPNIRHQLLKILDVACDAPIANATGAV